jgi:hypothetical protein
MNWYRLAQSSMEINHYDEDSDEYDPYEVSDGIESAFNESKIRPSNDSDPQFFALMGEDVAGGTYSNWRFNEEEDIATYSFDVAVLEKYRGRENVGIKLIDSSIQYYENEKCDYEDMGYRTEMLLWVINPKLVKFFENCRDFEIVSENSDGSAHMVRY